MARLISGVVLAVFFIGITLYGGATRFVFFWELVIIIGLLEYFKMLKTAKIEASTGVGVGCGVLLSLSVINHDFFVLHFTIFAIIAVAFTHSMMRAMPRGGKPATVSIHTVFGAIYVTIPLSYLILIRGTANGEFYVMLVCAATWFGDTAAYYGGKNFGRIPLAPAISPKKTIEGVAFGMVGSLAGALAVKFILFPGVGIMDCVMVALIAGFFGPIGDLSESALKRYYGVKDSGGLIPGHGGVLDRTDSIMFSAPIYFFYLTYLT